MKKTNQNGYAIIFTVVLVSIISLLVMGLANTTLKQLILSLGAKDSQNAFFQSDMATECAMYASFNLDLGTYLNFSCGLDKDGENPVVLDIEKKTIGQIISYSLPSSTNSEYQSSTDPCFRINITEDHSKNPVETRVEGSGYNICDTGNSRTVERTIVVNY